MTPEELVGQALAAMKFAYVPYSGFTVGAAPVSDTHLTLPTKLEG